MDVDDTRLGTVSLEPDGPVLAGSVGQWTLAYTVGSYGIDDGGTIKVAQRFASDWERPQFDRPTDSGYTTVRTSGAASLAVRYDLKGHIRPWTNCMVIDVYDGSLDPGDTVTITLGDRSAGSPGIRAQTFQESGHEFRVLVDPTNANVVRRLPTSPMFAVLADEPVELVCIVPTQAAAGETIEVFVKGQDRWGNPTVAPPGVQLRWEGDAPATLDGTSLTVHEPGSGYVLATAPGGLAGASNPITALAERPAFRRFWGDLHAQSDATVGTGSEEEYFTFGRDAARLDFLSHQGNDFQVTDDDWRRLNDTVRRFHADGRFVAFPGYEWSGNTPTGGDRNVIYLEEGLPIFRSSHWQVRDVPEDELSPASPVSVLFERLRARCEGKALVAAHVGGRQADVVRYFDPEIGPLLEVASCWGVFEWLLTDALGQGHIVGVVCNSDGHKGRPGAEGPGLGEFGIAGGLTCVLATDLTRRSVFDALASRRCYGTTGPRMDVSFEIDGQLMGSIARADGPAAATATVRGQGPVESLTLYRGAQAQVVRQARPAAFDSAADSTRVRVHWGGARIRARGRRVCWNGSIRTEGVQIVAAAPFAFDAPTDGITDVTAQTVSFRSQTTGDVDGIDLTLAAPRPGKLVFDSDTGRCECDLDELDRAGGRQVSDFGGIGMHVSFERYPEQVEETDLSLACEVPAPTEDREAYWVKVVQVDGHMAWTSPIYLTRG